MVVLFSGVTTICASRVSCGRKSASALQERSLTSYSLQTDALSRRRDGAARAAARVLGMVRHTGK